MAGYTFQYSYGSTGTISSNRKKRRHLKVMGSTYAMMIKEFRQQAKKGTSDVMKEGLADGEQRAKDLAYKSLDEALATGHEKDLGRIYKAMLLG